MFMVLTCILSMITYLSSHFQNVSYSRRKALGRGLVIMMARVTLENENFQNIDLPSGK